MSPAKRLAPLLLLTLAFAARAGEPSYTASGDLVTPADYREWIYLSSGIDMSYNKAPPMQGASMFDNVFVDRTAWQSFKQTGHWPDMTMLALEGRGAETHGSINGHGQFQTTELMGVEFHVRDEHRFPGGWAFFASDGSGIAKRIPASAACYSCHLAHGALDTTFTQFYPTAKEIAKSHSTLLDR